MEDLTLDDQTKLMNGSNMQKKRYGRYGLNQDIMSMVIMDESEMMGENQFQNDYLHQSFTINKDEQNSKSIETLNINTTSHQPSRNNLNDDQHEEGKALGF